jgi:hypothetical protein
MAGDALSDAEKVVFDGVVSFLYEDAAFETTFQVSQKPYTLNPEP